MPVTALGSGAIAGINRDPCSHGVYMPVASDW